VTLFHVIFEKTPFGERRERGVGCGELHFLMLPNAKKKFEIGTTLNLN
jgi:hypothetical protein